MSLRSGSSVLDKHVSSAGLPIRRSSQYPMGPMLFRGPATLEAYSKIFFLFGFLVDFPLKKDTEIKKAAQRFREHYPKGIEFEFADEMVHFKYFTLQT